MRKNMSTGLILLFCVTVLFTCIGYLWIVRKEANSQDISYGSKELYIKNVEVEGDGVDVTQYVSTMLTLNVSESARDVVITVTVQNNTELTQYYRNTLVTEDLTCSTSLRAGDSVNPGESLTFTATVSYRGETTAQVLETVKFNFSAAPPANQENGGGETGGDSSEADT